MLTVPDCVFCKHQYSIPRDEEDKKRFPSNNCTERLACTAFPEGIPHEFSPIASTLPECNRGVSFEPEESMKHLYQKE